MAPTMHFEPSTDPALDGIVRRAWRRYLRETRDAPPSEYEGVEEREWERLTRTLHAVGVRPTRLERPDEP